jgi:hypothetical protein
MRRKEGKEFWKRLSLTEKAEEIRDALVFCERWIPSTRDISAGHLKEWEALSLSTQMAIIELENRRMDGKGKKEAI